MSVISFLVSSGSTSNNACEIGPYFLVYANLADEATQCGGCYSGGLNCWPCLQANPPADTLFIDSGCTIPVQTGYYSNEYGSGIYATIYTINGVLQQAGFQGCSVQPTPTPTGTSQAVTPTQTPTNTETPTNTPTVTQTPSVTPTNTGTPAVTPTNTPTPSITPSVSVSSLPSSGVNFKKIAQDYQKLADSHKQLNSFGLGNSDQLSYWTQTRDKEENTQFQSPYYPLLYVVPSTITNDLEYKTWEFNTIVADLLERTLANQVDITSDTLQILQDIISQWRLSVSAKFGNYYTDYFVDDEVNCTPFLGQEDDYLNGWNGVIKIKTMTPLNRCAAAYLPFTGSPIQHVNGINLKTFYEDFKMLADYHKQLNSFGFGSIDGFQYTTQLRDKEDNTQFQSPYYPLMYVVPNDVVQKFNYMEYKFDIIVADIIQRDLANQTDVLSDTNQIMDDIISQFRLSVTQSLGNFNNEYYLDNPIVCTPFIEQYDDLLGGWTATLNIQVMTPLNRCDAAFFESFVTPSPTATATQTPTPTGTPEPTTTPTNTPSPTNTETPTQTPTPSVTTSMTPTQTPSETPTNTPTVTQTPTQTLTPTAQGTCVEYLAQTIDNPLFWNYTDCYGNPQSFAIPFGTNEYFCAIQGSVVITSGDGTITYVAPCVPPTQTPTNTPTNTATPTLTQTPTPSGGGGGNKLWNTNTTNWDSETGLWNTV